MCWFEAGITKSSGRPEPGAGLGLLGGSLCVHYNDEPDRRARAYRVAKGEGGGVVESPLPARLLPAPAPATLREDIAEFRRINAMRKKAGWLG